MKLEALITPLTEAESLSRLRGAAEALGDWYKENARRLPWREREPAESYPYRVWVSEIMLQQTRVEAVLPYYERFLAALPDILSLAAADDEKLRKLWEGLGYYSRVRNLKKGAGEVAERFGGQLPADITLLRSISGIGEYTAGAIGSIAFGLPEPAVDGNFLRVFSRLLAAEGDIARPAVKAAFREILREVFRSLPDTLHPGDLNQAVMDLGSAVCIPKSPRCGDCPAARYCLACEQDQASLFPVKGEKKARRVEERTVLIIIREGKVLLHKRPETGLLGGLWEFPNLDGAKTEAEVRDYLQTIGLSPGKLLPLAPARHIFTHIQWEMSGFLALCGGEIPSGWEGADARTLKEQYTLPSAFKVYRKAAEEWLSDGLLLPGK